MRGKGGGEEGRVRRQGRREEGERKREEGGEQRKGRREKAKREERKREGRWGGRWREERRVGDSHVDNEGMQNRGKNGLLAVDMLHLSQPDHLRDGHDLEGKELSCGDVTSQYHATKCSCA